MYTLAISEDGSRVFAFGKSDDCAFGRQSITGDHHQPMVSCMDQECNVNSLWVLTDVPLLLPKWLYPYVGTVFYERAPYYIVIGLLY